MKHTVVNARLPRTLSEASRALNIHDLDGDILRPVPYPPMVALPEAAPPHTPADWPEVSVEAADITSFSSRTQAMTLTGDYTHWAGPLAAADSARISAAMAGARREARARAEAAGMLCRPALVWYTLHDDRGGLLHRSVPKLIAPADPGASLTANVGLTSGNGYNQMPELEVMVTAWRLRLTVPQEVSSAALLRLHCAPLPDTLPKDTRVIASFGAHDAASAQLTLRFPETASSAEAAARRVDKLYDGAVTLLTLPAPFTGAAAVVKAGGPGVVSADTAPASGLAGECSPPHAFSSGVSAAAGDLMVYGDITPLRALPAGVLWLAAAKEAAVAWTAVTRVTLRHPGGGEEVLSVSQSGTGGCPVALSPLIVYPHPAAVRMEIGVAGSDGSRRGVTLDLTPTPGGCAACHVEPGLEPVALVDIGTLPTPLVRRTELRHPGALLVAEAGAPRLPTGALEALEGTVTAVAQAGPATSSLDFGRRHLHVFTTSGIYLIAARETGALAARRLDVRAVASQALVAPSPEGNYAVASDELLLVGGAKVTRIDSAPGCVALGREPRRGTLLMLFSCGTLTARYPSGGVSAIIPPPDLSGFMTLPGHLIGIKADDTFGYDFSDADSDEVMPVDVMLRLELPAATPGPRRLPSAIEWGISSPSADLNLMLDGSNGGVPVRVMAARVAGALTLPPRVRVLPGRPLARQWVSVSGKADVTTEIRYVKIDL